MKARKLLHIENVRIESSAFERRSLLLASGISCRDVWRRHVPVRLSDLTTDIATEFTQASQVHAVRWKEAYMLL